MRFALLILAAFAATPALAQAPAAPDATSPRARMTACNADAKAQALKGAGRKAFMSNCLKGEPPVAAAPAAASPAAVPAPGPGATPPKTAAPAGGRQPSPAQLAERERIKQCGAEWRADKAAGKVAAGQTWPKYWSACNTRLKGG